VSEWISIKDELPEDNREYLTLSEGIISTAKFWALTGKFLSCDVRVKTGQEITHWAFLPEPPINL